MGFCEAGEAKVLVPGDPEREFEKERMQDGIELLQTIVADLKQVGEKLGVSFLQ